MSWRTACAFASAPAISAAMPIPSGSSRPKRRRRPPILRSTLGGAGSTVGSLTYANGGGAVSTGANTAVMRAGVWEVRKKICSFVADSALEWKSGSNTLTGGFYFADYTTRDSWSLGNEVLLAAGENARAAQPRLWGMAASPRRTASPAGRASSSTPITAAADYALYACRRIPDHAGTARGWRYPLAASHGRRNDPYAGQLGQSRWQRSDALR